MKNLQLLPNVLAYSILAILFLLISKLIYDLFSRYKLDHELTKEDNPAVGIALAGYFIGMIIIIGSVIPDTSRVTLIDGLIEVAIYSTLGIILLNISKLVTDELILYKFKITKELIEDRNSGTGFVVAGVYVASALIIAASIAGSPAETFIKNNNISKEVIKPFGELLNGLSGEPYKVVSGVLLSIIFFLLGQVTLIIYSFVYSYILPFKIQEEIEKDNVAAGLAFGGGLLALGIILFRGIRGDGHFYGWNDSLTYFGWLIIFAIIVFPLIRIFVDRIMLTGSRLTEEIVRDRNVNAALLEIICLNLVSTIICFAY